MWFIILSTLSASAQDVQSRSTDDGAEYSLVYEDGETVTATFRGGVFDTEDAERAVGMLGDHLFENMEAFRTGGGNSWVDVDISGTGGGMFDGTPLDELGIDVDPGAAFCGVDVSVGDVLISFGVALPGEGDDEIGEEPDGFSANTGGLADGDNSDMEPSFTDADRNDEAGEGAETVDAIYDGVMRDLFGDNPTTGSFAEPEPASPEQRRLGHELVHVVQQERASHLQDTGWEGTLDEEFEIEDPYHCLPEREAEANINWNILGAAMYVQPDPTRTDEEIVEGEDTSPILLIGNQLAFEANAAYLHDDSAWDTDPSPHDD
jgi:hypothetical protein